MNSFICVLVGCVLSAQAFPRPTFDLLGGGSPLSSVEGLAAGVSGGLNPSAFAGVILKGFGGAKGAGFKSFLSAFEAGLSHCGPDGSVPIGDFSKAFQDAGGDDALPVDAFGDIFKGLGGGDEPEPTGFSNIFGKYFEKNGKIPAEFASKFEDVFKSKDDISPQEFSDVLQKALESAKGAEGSFSSSKDSLSLDHHQSSDLSINKDSEKSEGFGSEFGF